MDAEKPLRTIYGLEFQIAENINSCWSNYDQFVAKIHLDRVNVVIIDCVYLLPIDNENDLDEIYKKIEK